MVALRTIAGRIGYKRKLVRGLTAGTFIALLMAIVIPTGLVPAGGSAALAELLARSPGERIGGVALKAKQRRAALSPQASGEAPPGAGGVAPPQNAFASVLGSSAGPEDAIPGAVTEGPGGFPSDFLAPDAPVGVASPPIALPSVPGLPGSPFAPLPPLVPPAPELPPGAPDTVPVGGIPEPGTWLMLIIGFGAMGQAARRRSRAALA